MPWGVAAAVVGSAMTASATQSASENQAAAMQAAAQGTNLSPWAYNGPGGTGASLSNYGPGQNTNTFTGYGQLAGLGMGGNTAGSSPLAAPARTPTGQPVMPGQPGQPSVGTPGGTNAAYNPFGSTGNTGLGFAGYAAGGSPNGYNAPANGAQAGAGLGGPIGNQGGNINVNLGSTLNSTFGGLSNLGANMVGQAGITANSGLPQNVANANTALQKASPTAAGTQGGLGAQVQQNLQTENQANSLVNAGQQQIYNPLIGYAQGAAANQINAANTGYTANYNSALGQNLAALAIPQQQQTTALTDSEFGRGQLGTSGGALQTQAQAAGFGQSDLAAAISAQSQAEAQQQTAGSLANSFSGIATGQQASGTNMMSTGMGQANNASNVAGNNLNNIYNQNQNINNTAYQRALTNVGTQTSLAGLPQQLASNDLALGMSALNGASGINTMGQSDENAALAASQAQSNAQNKAASNMGNIASQGNFGMSPGSYGGMLTSAGSNIAQGNISNPFANITGNNANYATAGMPNSMDTSGTAYTPTQDPSITGADMAYGG